MLPYENEGRKKERGVRSPVCSQVLGLRLLERLLKGSHIPGFWGCLHPNLPHRLPSQALRLPLTPHHLQSQWVIRSKFDEAVLENGEPRPGAQSKALHLHPPLLSEVT